MQKLISSVSFVSLVFGMAPVFPAVAEEGITLPPAPEVVVEDQTVVAPTDTLHFVLDVRWGNVEGEPTTKDEAIFDGSIASPAGGHVSLRRTLLFEDNDSITMKVDPVSWTSKIYGHWDGVRVLVSAKASDSLTVSTAQGSLTKTAQELFQAGAPILQDVGNGREIVVHARPLEKRGFFLVMGWGSVVRSVEGDVTPPPPPPPTGTTQLDLIPLPEPVFQVNFSGSATVNGGGKLQLVKPVRFESNDAITSRTETSVAWTSYIAGHVDGLLLRVHPDRMMDASDALAVTFTNLNFNQSFALADLFHQKVTRVPLTVNGQSGHELFFKVIQHPNKKLMRARNDHKVWLIEDDLRRHVISPDAFAREGLHWEDVEVTSEENVDIYAEGDSFGYDDGTLIKGSGPPVWVLADGKRRHIGSPAAFERLGFAWGRITEIPDSDVAQYPETAPVTETSDAPEGSLIQAEGLPTVYQIKGGKRLPIPSLAVFSGNKFGWENVMEVKMEIRDKFPQGQAVGYPDGSLLVSDDGQVNVISNGERQWVRTAADFTGRGYEWNETHHVSTSDLNHYPQGPILELADLH